MHELAIASEIVDLAVDTAADADADTIDALTLAIGTATHLNPEQVRFCVETVAEDTPAADADVELERVEPEAECECGWRGEPTTREEFGPTVPDRTCPACGDRVTLTRGDGCRLASVTVPDDE